MIVTETGYEIWKHFIFIFFILSLTMKFAGEWPFIGKITLSEVTQA